MFGPNPVPGFHHRSAEFHRLMDGINQLFHAKFGYNGFDLIFMTGSGALALEACIYSSKMLLRPMVTGHKFSNQLRACAMAHEKDSRTSIGGIPLWVQYETSRSMLNTHSQGGIVDCVSSFPFFLPPTNASAWVTVSGKQLKGPPGLAVIAVHKAAWGDIFETEMLVQSYLDIGRHYQAMKNCETPNTPAITLLQQFKDALEAFNFAKEHEKVLDRWAILCDMFGEPPGQVPPVYTFNCRVPYAHDYLGLYGDPTQIFLYSGTDDDFDKLVSILRRAKNEMPGTNIGWNG